MVGKRWYMLVLAVLLLALGACAPKATPTPAPTPIAPAVTPATPAPTAPALSPEEAAWARVVEAAKKEGKVNAYAWGWTGDIGLAVARAFENRYGIKVEILTGRGAEFLERLKTEKRMSQVVADFVEGAASHSENMKMEGLLASGGDLPVLRQKGVFAVDPFILSPEGYYYVYNQFYKGLHINTNLVKPGEEPKAFVDLLDPKWRGRILMLDPVLSDYISTFAVFIESRKTLTLDFLERLSKQDLKFDPSGASAASRLARGEFALSAFATPDTAVLAREGAPIKVIDTREGILVSGNAIAIVKNGPHPNAALVLANWMLSQEGQDTFCKAKGMLSVRKDVPDYQHPAVQLKPQNPVFVTVKENDLVARVFRERQYVPFFKPK